MAQAKKKVVIKPGGKRIGPVSVKGVQGFLPGNAGGGSRKGCPNKFTSLKQAFLDAFNDHRVGGVEGLIKWIIKTSDNRKNFYQWITRMLPRTVDLQGVDPVSPGSLQGLKDEELDAVLIGVGRAVEAKKEARLG